MIADAAEGIELSVHVWKCGSVHIDCYANLGAEVFLARAHVVKVSIVGEKGHELGCVFRVALRQRIERADNLLVAGFFGWLAAHDMPFEWGRVLSGAAFGSRSLQRHIDKFACDEPGSFHGKRRRPRGRLSFPFLLWF